MADTVLLDRDAELARLSAVVEPGAGGRVVVVSGPAGIGKSALVDAALDHAAEAGCTVLRAQGFEMERGFAFGVARQLVKGITPPGEGAARLVLPLIDPAAAQAASVESVVHGAYWLLSSLSEEGRVVIAVDDAHWADEESRLLIHYLAMRLADLDVALVLGVRSGEDGADALMRLGHDSSAELIEPGPLSLAATERLVLEEFNETDPDFVEACWGASGGNPLLLRELLLGMRSEGGAPGRAAAERLSGVTTALMTHSVLARVLRAGEAASAVAVAVAVLGEGCNLAETAELAGCRLEEAAEACDRLAQADVLIPGVPLEFRHPVLRSAVYEDVGPARRRALHTRAAEVLLRSRAEPERIAAQLVEGEPLGAPGAASALQAAAENALRSGASKRAARYLERALREQQGDRGEILAALGRLRAAELAPDALDLLQEAAELTSDPETANDLLLEQARVLVTHGRTQDAIALLGEHAGALSARSEAALLIDAELIALGQLDVLPSGVVDARVERYMQDPPAGDTPGECAVLGALAFEACRAVEPREACAALATRAMNRGHLEALPPSAPARIVTPIALRQTEEIDLAERHGLTALTQARERGSDLAFAIASFDLGQTAHWRGDLKGAEEHFSDVLQTAGPEGHPLNPYAAGFLALLALDSAGPARAREILDDTGLSDLPAEEILFNEILYCRGCVAAACGDTEAAIADLTACGERELAHGHRNPAGTPWRTALAMTFRQAGDHARAAEDIATELKLARRFGAPRILGIALRAKGLIEGGHAGLETLGEAVEALARSPDRLELARALIDHGAALRRAKRRADSREPLSEGTDLAARCGAPALAERGLTELRALGARPRRYLVRGVESLTPSERRVARMAAEGMSNPEIAQALFVTRKTVEAHLGRIYPKLDIRGRDELAAALGESTGYLTDGPTDASSN